MAYYLEVDGTVEYVSFANILITGDYFITAKFIPQQANPNADGIFLGRESNTWLGVSVTAKSKTPSPSDSSE